MKKENNNLKLVPIIFSLIIGFISALGKDDDFIANNSITILAILLSLYVLLCSFMNNAIQRVHKSLDTVHKKEQLIERAEGAFSMLEDEIENALLKVGVCALLLIFQNTLLHYFSLDWLVICIHTIVNAYMVRTYFHFYGWITNMFRTNVYITKK